MPVTETETKTQENLDLLAWAEQQFAQEASAKKLKEQQERLQKQILPPFQYLEQRASESAKTGVDIPQAYQEAAKEYLATHPENVMPEAWKQIQEKTLEIEEEKESYFGIQTGKVIQLEQELATMKSQYRFSDAHGKFFQKVYEEEKPKWDFARKVASASEKGWLGPDEFEMVRTMPEKDFKELESRIAAVVPKKGERGWAEGAYESVAKGAERTARGLLSMPAWFLPESWEGGPGAGSLALTEKFWERVGRIRDIQFGKDPVADPESYGKRAVFGALEMAPDMLAAYATAGITKLKYGAKAGKAAATGYFYLRGIRAIYDGMKQDGVSDEVSRPLAMIFAAPYALIENLQLQQLAPGIKQVAMRRAEKSLWGLMGRFGTQELKNTGAEWGEELLQSITQVTADAVAHAIETHRGKLKRDFDWRGKLDQAKAELFQAALSLPVLRLPGAAVDLRSTVSGAINSRREFQKEHLLTEEGLQEWLAAHQTEAKIATEKETPSRTDWEKAGLPRMEGTERKAVAERLRTTKGEPRAERIPGDEAEVSERRDDQEISGAEGRADLEQQKPEQPGDQEETRVAPEAEEPRHLPTTQEFDLERKLTGEQHQQNIQDLMKEEGLSQEQAERISAKEAERAIREHPKDTASGWEDARTEERKVAFEKDYLAVAQEVAKSGTPVILLNIDMAGQGSLNAAEGETSTWPKSDVHIRKILGFVREEIEKAGPKGRWARVGSDEFRAVLEGITEEQAREANAKAQKRIYEYASTTKASDGQYLSEIWNLKYSTDLTKRGIGVIIGVRTVTSDETAAQIISGADADLGVSKKKGVYGEYGKKAQTSRPMAPERQAGRAPKGTGKEDIKGERQPRGEPAEAPRAARDLKPTEEFDLKTASTKQLVAEVSRLGLAKNPSIYSPKKLRKMIADASKAEAPTVFESMIPKLERSMTKFAGARGLRGGDVEGAVTDALTAAHEAHQAWKPGTGNQEAYVQQAARNAVMSYVKKFKGGKEIQGIEEIEEPEAKPVVSETAAEEIGEAIAEIKNEQDRKILEMIYAGGKTPSEIAEALGISRQAVHQHLQKPAIQKLGLKIQEILAKTGGTEPSTPSSDVIGFPETAAKRETWPADVTTRRTEDVSPPRKLMQARDIINFIKKKWMIPVRGKATFTKRAAGWFSPATTEIRQKNVRSITVAIHELGHHIDWTLNKRWSKKPPEKAISDELVQLGKDLYGDTKPPGGYKSEGWAEFIREFLTGGKVQDRAPNLYSWFVNEYLPQNRQLAKNLSRLEIMVADFAAQGAEGRVKAFRTGYRRDWDVLKLLARSWAWVEDKWIDFNIVISRNMKRAGIDRTKLAAEEDPYLLATKYSMAAGAKARHAVLVATTDLADQVTGESLQDALEPVAAQGKKALDNFKSYIVSMKALILESRGIESGISKADAQAVVDKYDSPEFKDAAKRVTDWSRRVLYLLVESGKIDVASFNQISEMNPIYVPFMRQFEEGEIRADLAGSGMGGGLFRIVGSGREVMDPLDALVMQAERISSMAMGTDVLRSIARLYDKTKTKSGETPRQPGISHMISEVPAPTEVTTFTAEKIKGDVAKILKSKGADIDALYTQFLENWENQLTVFTEAGQYRGKDNIVAIDVDGKRRWFEVSPDLYRLIRGLNKKNRIPGTLGTVTRKIVGLQRLGATGLNPAFGLLRNFERDTITGTMTYDYAKGGPLASIRGIINDLRDTGMAQQYHAAGVDLAGWIGQDKPGAERLIKKATATTSKGKILVTITEPIQALRAVFGVTEAGPRLAEYEAAYKQAIAEGKSLKSAAVIAAVAAKDVTVNFSRAGEYGRMLNEIVLFFNAGVQSIDKLGRTFWKHPVRTALRAGSYITFFSMMNYYRNRDEEWWKDLPGYEKWSYTHIAIPGTDTVIRIPLPFEFGALFGALPVAAIEELRTPGTLKKAWDVMANNVGPELMPAVLSPIRDIWRNEDWAGRSIVPQHIAETRLPEDQFTQYTTEIAKKIGSLAGWSPAKVEHLINSYSGGLYRRLARSIDNLKDPSYFIEEPAKLPVLGTLFLRKGLTKTVNEFYERTDLLKQKVGSQKASLEEIGELKGLLSLQHKFRPIWEETRSLQKETTAESRAKIKELRREADQMVKEFQGKDKAEHVKRAIGSTVYSLTAKKKARNSDVLLKRLENLTFAEMRSALVAEYKHRGYKRTASLSRGKLTAFGKRMQRLRRMLKK